MLARLRCFVRQYHQPVRHPLGGFRCVECGAAGADLDEMGFPGSGWVAPTRRTYGRPDVDAGRFDSSRAA
jgi:hypothetical protein